MTLEAVDHVQLAIPAGGENAARAFYVGVLGLIEQPKPPELAKRGGCWFEGAVTVHLGVEEPFRPAKKAHIAFRVDDVGGLADRARAMDFEVVEDGDLPGHERVFVFDPFGNRLEFLKAVDSSSSLPFMGRVDSGVSPSGVGESGLSSSIVDSRHFSTPLASRVDPLHEGEGGRK